MRGAINSKLIFLHWIGAESLRSLKIDSLTAIKTE